MPPSGGTPSSAPTQSTDNLRKGNKGFEPVIVSSTSNVYPQLHNNDNNQFDDFDDDWSDDDEEINVGIFLLKQLDSIIRSYCIKAI